MVEYLDSKFSDTRKVSEKAGKELLNRDQSSKVPLTSTGRSRSSVTSVFCKYQTLEVHRDGHPWPSRE